MTSYVALGFDPAPGCGGAVRDLLRTAADVAAELGFLERKLRDIGEVGSGWEGRAALAFRQRVGELPPYLNAATGAADLARRALARWADHLDRLQREAAAYERAAADAREDLRRAQDVVRTLRADLRAATPEDQAAAVDAVARAQRAVDAARRRLDDVLGSAQRVLEDHQALAAACAADLDRAAEFAPPEPGFFERVADALGDLAAFVASIPEQVREWVRDNAALIKAIADVFADVATILGIVAIFLPPPANVIVAGIAAGSAVFALAGHAISDYGGADVSGLTYTADALSIVGFGFTLIGYLGQVGATAARVEHLAHGRAGGVKAAEEAFTYYQKVDRVYGGTTDLVGNASGTAGTIREGGIPFEHWVPRTPGQALLGATSPIALAFWNAANAGADEDVRRREQELRDAWLQ